MITNHAKERALQRYGFVPTDEEIQEILDRAHKGNLPVVSRGQKGVAYAITLRGKTMVPVIVEGRFIVTFKPPSGATMKGKRKHLINARNSNPYRNLHGGKEYRRPGPGEIARMAADE